MSVAAGLATERHAPWEVRHALWNPRMDLLALASVDGQVALERALVSVWKKTWQVALADQESASGRGANKSVEALAWSPDGRVLAVGTADGFVFLLDTETGE
uniref:Anaphase-promoting complex subunit 4-like WD40 domain-containing protein n=1 Tax=Plectus sambesii TaxID=2011161 RepID=A0A914WXM9_9BILA